MSVDHHQPVDRVFLALGHPIRRQILVQLAHGATTVSDIAQPYPLSLNAISKHLKVLESAGLIEREVVGREHYCRIRTEPLAEVTSWLTYYQSFWSGRLEAMEQALLARKQEPAPTEE